MRGYMLQKMTTISHETVYIRL